MKNVERLGWGFAIVAAVVWGASRGGDAGSGMTAGEVMPGHGKGPAFSAEARGRVDSKAGPRGLHEARRGRDVGRRALQALRREDPFERMSEFLKILGDCEEDNISDVAAAFAELKSSGILLAAEESLLDHRLGQLGGPALFAGDLPSSGSGEEIARLKSRYNGWMQADPAAAKLWLDGLPPGKSRDQMLVAYISASAAGDPEGALREAATLPEVLKGQAGRSVAERLVQTGSMEEVSMLLSGLEERGDGSERYLGGIFDELLNGAVKNGVDPASLVERHFDQPYVNYSTLAKVSEQKAKADPVAALEWAAGLEGRKEGVPDGGVLAAALGGMKLEDLDQAEEWALANAGRAGVESLLPFLQRQREALDGKGTDDDYDFDRDE